MQREPKRLPLPECDAFPSGGSLDLELDRTGKHEYIRASTSTDASFNGDQDREDEPVFGPGRVFDLDINSALLTCDLASQGMWAVNAEIVFSVPLTNDEGVGEDHGAGGARNVVSRTMVRSA